jgi:23S rRNA pseudouridine2605 synthase
MAEKTTPAKSSKIAAPKSTAPEGDRIAKVLSRAGIASRREAERMIELGEVSVNGKVITSPALNVTAKDKITVRGELVGEPEQARLWLYYKPDGLVTSESDEKGRETVFDNLPEELPRVMSVGRLDLNSEGLLLLTNDGALKRRLELPSTGWLRKYRVRINGNPTDPDLEPLRKGIEVDGERFQPMIVILDRIQGANAWLTVGLREGKNREIRRALNAINLTVNRLIRVSYGPFRLGDLQPGQVEEVKGKVLRDQLGEGRTPEDDAPRKVVRAPRGAVASRTATGTRSETARNVSPRADGPRPATRVVRAKPGAAIKELADAWDAVTTKPRAPIAKHPMGDKTFAGKPKPKAAPEKPRNTPAAPRSASPNRGKPGPRPKRGE